MKKKKEIDVEFPNERFLRLFEPCRIKIFHGGRGGGKSHAYATALIVKSLQKKMRILCAREIQNSIKESVHELLTSKILEIEQILGTKGLFEITNNTIRCVKTGSEFFFRGLRDTSSNIGSIKSIEGIDVCWVEEAQCVSNKSLEVLIPTIRKEGSEIWFSMNRYSEQDPVWLKFSHVQDCSVMIEKINYYDNIYCPRVLLEEAEREKQRDFQSYLHVWEGEPYSNTHDSIIGANEIKDAINRDIPLQGGEVIGIDVARFGKDRTIFYKRKGNKVVDFREFTKQSIEETYNKACLFANYNKETRIHVDDTGIGGGLTDRLQAQGYCVVPVIFGAKATDSKYVNLVTEMWFNVKEHLHEISIPNDPDLIAELTNRKYGFTRDERICIESKDEYKKRAGRSPDKADALLLCFCYTHKSKMMTNFLDNVAGNCVEDLPDDLPSANAFW